MIQAILTALLITAPIKPEQRNCCDNIADGFGNVPSHIREKFGARIAANEPRLGLSNWLSQPTYSILRDDPPIEIPKTDDKSLDVDAKAEANHKKDIEDDIKLGKEVAVDITKEMKSSTNQEMIDRVNRIGTELAQIANGNKVTVPWGDPRLNKFPYTFTVLQGGDVNAFSIPGGYIYVYEGLINYAETDHELAGVLAHEISHAAFRHLATLQREQSKLQAITLPLILLSLLSGTNSGQGIATGASLYNQAKGSGWSVNAENAADYGAVQYLMLAGGKYQPVGMLTFIERLAYDERNRPQYDWGIYRTHPPSKERANSINKALISFNLPRQRSISSTTFQALVKPGQDASQEVWLNGTKIVTFNGLNAKTRSNEAAEKLTRFVDSTPRIFEVGQRGAAVIGGNNEIFEFDDDDEQIQKLTKEALASQASKALKQAIYGLNFKIWDHP